MQYLEEKGFHSITMEQLESHILHGSPLPDKPIVLTFDDGYKDNVETALPILKKYHQIGNVFSIANWRGKENKWENFGKELTVTMNDEELLPPITTSVMTPCELVVMQYSPVVPVAYCAA